MQTQQEKLNEEKDRKRAHSVIQLTDALLSDVKNAFLVFTPNPDDERFELACIFLHFGSVGRYDQRSTSKTCELC